MSPTLDEIALAYELRQGGCCWKRIAQGLGIDTPKIKSAVEHAVKFGIKKGLDGYPRQSGRAATFSINVIRAAARLRGEGKDWSAVGAVLNADPHKLKCAHQYAKCKGMID